MSRFVRDRRVMTKSRYRFRLTLGIPLVVICFTLAAGFFPLGMIESTLGRYERPIDLKPFLTDLKVVALLIAFVATGIAVAISRHILEPVEQMIGGLRELRPDSESGELQTADDEITSLSNLYNQTFVPLKGYLRSADLFMQMNEGIISLNTDKTVAFLNAPVEKLLEIKREDYLGKSYTDLFPMGVFPSLK